MKRITQNKVSSQSLLFVSSCSKVGNCPATGIAAGGTALAALATVLADSDGEEAGSLT